MRQSLGDCTGQDVLSCIFLFFIKLYLGLILGRLERLFALAEAGKLGPESPLAARAPRAEGGVASAAGQASAQRDQDLISGLWASFVGWASSNPSYGSAAGGSAETDPENPPSWPCAGATSPTVAPTSTSAPAAPIPPAAPAAPAAPTTSAATAAPAAPVVPTAPAAPAAHAARGGMARSRPATQAPVSRTSPASRLRRAQAPPRASPANRSERSAKKQRFRPALNCA
jgi:hypothetical protein